MRRVALCVLFSLLLVGVALTAVAEEKVLRIGNREPLGNIDPAVCTTTNEGVQVTVAAYDTLLRYDLNDFDIQPSLAGKWEVSSDGKSITFYLRKGVEFHDGSEFNADAVAYSFDRMMAVGSAPSSVFTTISGYETPDAYTIRFFSETPFGLWEDVFASHRGLRIVSPSAAQAHATTEDPWAVDWFSQNECGTGPYTLVRWEKGDYLEMVRFEEYWRGWTGAEFDRWFNVPVSDIATRIPLIRSGEVDTIAEPPTDLIGQLVADPGVTVVPAPSVSKFMLFLKCSQGPLANKALREAIRYAVDYEEIASTYAYATLSPGLIPEGFLGHDPTLPTYYGRDIAKAKAKKLEAGYAADEPITLTMAYASVVEYHRQTFLLLQEMLADLNITIEGQAYSFGPYVVLVADPTTSPDMYIGYRHSLTADPHPIFVDAFSPASAESKTFGWNNGYNNPEVGDLITLAAQEPDRNARAEIYKQIQAFLVEDVAALFIWNVPYLYVYRSDLHGIVPDRTSNFCYFPYDMWR